MITCYLRYEIDPYQLKEFEAYAKMWIPLIETFGGTMHGYFLPHEGPNHIAVALFSFASLAAYEEYRAKASKDPDCQKAVAFARNNRCFLRYERSFLKKVAI